VILKIEPPRRDYLLRSQLNKIGRDNCPNRCTHHNLETQEILLPPKAQNSSVTKSKDTEMAEVPDKEFKKVYQ
jgi:hypothetical protein